MRALGGIADKAAVDPRASSAGKTPGGRADGDAGSQAFGGVLTDVGAEVKATGAKATPPTDKAAPTDAKAVPTDTKPAPAGDAAPMDAVAALDPTALDALIDKVGGTSAAASKIGDTAADPTVESLLKRLKGGDKEPDTASGATADASASGTTPTAATALLAATTGTVTANAAATPPPTAAGAPATAADRKASRAQDAPPTSKAAVTDVAVATHLASTADAKPATDSTPSPTAAGTPSNDARQTPATETNASPVAISPATAADSESSTGQHGRDPDGSAGAARTIGSKETQDGTTALDGAGATGVSSPIQKIEAALKSVAAQAAAATSETAAAPIAPARTLTLQISPTDLGPVDVKMHMAADGLDIQLTIADQQTLGVVTRERDALTSALQGQHYAVHSLVIQDGGAAAQPGGQHASQGQSSGTNSSGTDARPGGKGGDGRDNPSGGGGDRYGSSRGEAQGGRVANGDSGGGALIV